MLSIFQSTPGASLIWVKVSRFSGAPPKKKVRVSSVATVFLSNAKCLPIHLLERYGYYGIHLNTKNICHLPDSHIVIYSLMMYGFMDSVLFNLDVFGEAAIWWTNSVDLTFLWKMRAGSDGKLSYLFYKIPVQIQNE